MKLFLFIVTFLFVNLLMPAWAQSSGNSSVWAWKLSGAARSVYLLGEMHRLVGDFNFKVDHSLGINLISKSSEVWVESIQDDNDSSQPITFLPSQVSTATWAKTEKVVFDAVQIIASNENSVKKEALANAYLKSISSSQPTQAYGLLIALNTLLKRKSNPLNNLSHQGLRLSIAAKKSQDVSKFRLIEGSNSSALAWRNNCDDRDADNMISSALNTVFASDTVGTELQRSFLQPSTSSEELNQKFLAEPGGVLYVKCAIRPRDLGWLPSLIKIIQTPGEPVVFLFGIGHFIGENGLLDLLAKSGYSNIQRIYKPE